MEIIRQGMDPQLEKILIPYLLLCTYYFIPSTNYKAASSTCV